MQPRKAAPKAAGVLARGVRGAGRATRSVAGAVTGAAGTAAGGVTGAAGTAAGAVGSAAGTVKDATVGAAGTVKDAAGNVVEKTSDTLPFGEKADREEW